MMTPTICVLGFALVIAGQNPQMDSETRLWVAKNVCAAAFDSQIDPKILGAYILNENNRFDLWSVRPAVKGRDHGLFQTNSYYQRNRKNLAQTHHPYFGAMIAAEIIHENLKSYGWTWQAFAAYWSQGQASASTSPAKAYYSRLQKHYGLIDSRFSQAEKLINGSH
jgi:hypothetical protein